MTQIESFDAKEQLCSAAVLAQLSLLIFDLDGVITSETRYWNTARLTVWDVITNPELLGCNRYFGEGIVAPEQVLQAGETVIARQFIAKLKSRAVNSNWDLTFFVVCLHLIGILKTVDRQRLQALSRHQGDRSVEETLKLLGQLLRDSHCQGQQSAAIIERFWQETTDLKGSAVTESIPSFAQQVLGIDLPIFETKSRLWQFCYQAFQDWYEGNKGFTLSDDETVLDLACIDRTLRYLYDRGRYTLAIATGRPRNEVFQPLGTLGLLQYFNQNRIVTYDDVLEAETVMFGLGKAIKLGKPHPFVLHRAIHPDKPFEELSAEGYRSGNHPHAAYIGDAASDIVAAKRAGCVAIGVLTGFSGGDTGESKRQMFRALGCDAILDSILELPHWLGLNPSMRKSAKQPL